MAVGETRALARYVIESQFDDIPEDVRQEAVRALFNFVGCAVGGADHAACDIALRTFGPLSGPREAAIVGRAERLDPLHASLLNGISSHVHDYDDTTPKNYIHPTSPVASALFAHVCVNPLSGRDLILAFILGFEVTCRIGNAVFPAHYDAGWHITGTAGVFGAAAAIGKLIGLDEQQMVWALGLAATQAAGIREMFGAMGKAFHPGRAAQNGYGAALLAQNGFTGSEHGIEGPRGFAAVQSARFDLSRITARLGKDFDLRENAYKPFPCGIVNHPAIDACIQIRREHDLDPARIREVRLRVAPLVMDLCAKRDISKGLEGKFSVVHGAAVGLVRGKAGLEEYSDAAVNDPEVRRVREAAHARGDAAISEDSVEVEVELADGTVLSKYLEHSIGNLKRPMTNEQLEEKFFDQAVRVLPKEQVSRLVGLTWEIETLSRVSELVDASVPATKAAY